MDFLLIGDSKIKIVLNREEKQSYGLSGTEISTADSRRGFFRLIGLAKERVGFDPKGDKLLIQLYPTGDNLEVFVTKLGILPDASAKLVSRSDKVSLLHKKKNYYSFSLLEDLVSAARSVKGIAGKISLESDVYLFGDKYLLSIDEYGKGGDSVEFPQILEFSTPITAELSTYIMEHSDRLTSGDGIEIFSSL